uniref:Pseudouridine-5'-monophosphatase n=1 Tax=Anthurium amnicola TaxID=1678845 RepID=A0A1D1XEW7_9ARAE
MANPQAHEGTDGAAAADATKGSITHVIFDMDGLLLDTEGFYTLVQERILARFGKTFDWSLKARMMGKKAIEAARVFVEEMGLDGFLTPEGFLEEREEMLQELFPTAELMPGVKRLINHLHARGVPICVATGVMWIQVKFWCLRMHPRELLPQRMLGCQSLWFQIQD